MKIDVNKGGWIAYTNWVLDCRPMIDSPTAFRKDFKLSSKAVSGRLIVTAADKYALWLNGKLIGYGPARSYPRNKIYDEYDITPLLRKGVNRLAALITPCTGANFLANYTRMALFVQAEVVMANGKREWVVSDETWQSRIADWIRSNYLLISTPVGPQEHSDAAIENKDWKAGTPGTGWSPALYLGSVGMPPWVNLVPRPVPLLVEKPITPALVWEGRGERKMAETSLNVATLFNALPVDGKVVAPKRAEGVFADSIANVRVFDFGRTRLIRPGVEISDVKGTVRVELYYDIKLGDRPTAAKGFRFRTDGQADSCKTSEALAWETIVPRGFRFLTVKMSGPGTAKYRLACRSVDYPYEENASFESSDPFLSRAWEISKNNLRSSTNDAAVDCCNRENLLWAFDAFATCKAAFYSFGETRMWRRCLALIAEGIDSDGRPSAVVPTDVPSSLYGQAMHLPISIRDYYMATGDRSLLIETAAALRRYLEFCARYMTREDLFIPPTWSWHWLDWAPIDNRPYSLPVNALLVLSCDASAQIARVIGDKGLASVASKIGPVVRRAIARFYDAKARAFRSHIEPRTRLTLPPFKPNSRSTEVAMSVMHGVHGNVLAALGACGTAAMQRAALAHAAKCFAAAPGPANQIGTGYVDILLSPLCAAGYGGAAMAKARSMYQPFIDVGAPTWGEDAKEVSVFNTAHGWSAALNSFVVEGLVGLKAAGPGWKEATLKPPADVDVDYTYSLETPAGVLRVERSGGRVKVRWPRSVKARTVRGTT